MDRMAATLRRHKEDKSDGSFKFAISLIVAALTAVYKLYDYQENNCIESIFLCFITRFLILLMVMTLVLMGIFIFMKAISLEVNYPTTKEKLETFAARCYFGSFFFWFICSLTLVAMCVPWFIITAISPSLPSLSFPDKVCLNGIASLILLFFASKYNPISSLGLDDYIKNLYYLLIVALLLGFSLNSTTFIGLTNGNIILEVNDICNKQNEQIPIYITVTGSQFENLTVDISKVNFENNLTLIDSLKMESAADSHKIASSKYLTGNSYDCGKFKFYLSCTNLSEGYYEISATNYGEGLKSIVIIASEPVKTKTRSFYLIDKK